MKERYLSKTPFLTFVYISKCNINLPGYFGNSKKRFLWTGLMCIYILKQYLMCSRTMENTPFLAATYYYSIHISLSISPYDSIATVGEIRVYRRADFQSGSRVLKKVFWTFSYLYLWHTMWFHAKKLLRTLKFWKSLNSLCKSGSRPQKSPKKAQKTDHSIAIYSNFWIGMVYFGYHLVKAHVQTVQNMYGKGR